MVAKSCRCGYYWGALTAAASVEQRTSERCRQRAETTVSVATIFVQLFLGAKNRADVRGETNVDDDSPGFLL